MHCAETSELKSLKAVTYSADTIACITGGIAEAYYKTIPPYITQMVSIILGPDLMQDVIIPFTLKCSGIYDDEFGDEDDFEYDEYDEQDIDFDETNDFDND